MHNIIVELHNILTYLLDIAIIQCVGGDMGYRMDEEVFYSKMREAGFKSRLGFARRAGIHRNTLGQYLSGREVFQDAFLRVAAQLGCDPMDIVRKGIDVDGSVGDISEIRLIVDHLVASDIGIAVVLLGSRASGKGREFSDWDIGITCISKPIDGDSYLTLRGEVADLADDLPRGVDLINLDAAPAWFLRDMTKDPLLLGGNRESFAHFMGVLHGIKKEDAA